MNATKKHQPRKGRTVTVTAPVDGIYCDVLCALSGRHMPATRWEPEEWPEVDVLEIRDPESGALRDVEQLTRDERDRIEREALDAAGADERDAYEAHLEDEADRRREDRMIEVRHG